MSVKQGFSLGVGVGALIIILLEFGDKIFTAENCERVAKFVAECRGHSNVVVNDVETN